MFSVHRNSVRRNVSERRAHRRWVRCLLLGLWVSTAAHAAPAEEETASANGVSISERDQAFEETVDVQLVNVEVRVTDRRGRPIEGLTADDFEVMEDRRPVEVLHFSELRPSLRVSSAPIAPPEPADANALPSETPAREILIEEPTQGALGESAYLVFYFDNAHLRPGGRKRLIEDLRALVATGQIDAGRVLILVQNPQLEALAQFGSSPEEVLRGLDAVSRYPAEGPEIDRERGLLFDKLYELFEIVPEREGLGIGLSQCGLLQVDGLQEVQVYAQRVKARVATTLRHLATLSSALSGIPGPKSVLYFGTGLELVPIEDPLHYLSEVCPQMQEDIRRFSHRIDLTPRFQQLTRHANGNRVTFYTLDAGGLPMGSSSTVEFADFEWKPSILNDQIRRNNLQNSLSFMASDTGGRAIFNANRLGPEILKIQEEAYSFYSLAYAPPHNGDGRVHMIDVKVKRKGARVRHRLSYRDKAPDERMADRLQAALTLGAETNPMGVELVRGPSKLSGSGKVRLLPVRVTVPLESLVFVPREEGHMGRLRLQVAARDEEGRMSAFHQKHFEVELDPDLGGEARGRHTFVVDLEMRTGAHIVAVGLRDEIGREASFLASKVFVE